MKNNPWLKAGKITTKIIEVFHWVGALLMLAATVCALAKPEWVKYFVGITATEAGAASLEIYGFELMAPMADGLVDGLHLFLFGIGAVIILVLMAMVFRNLCLVIRNSTGSTPFQADNVCLLREIGIFSMAVPAVGLLMSVVCRLVLGAETETGVGLEGFFMGVVVLCLTQFFIYGMKLQKDVDGLL